MTPGDQEPDESLTALREALSGPKGDYVITVESRDRALLQELWTLQGEGVEVTERLEKSGDAAGLVYLVINSSLAVLTIIDRVLKMIETHAKGDKTHTAGDKKKAKVNILTKKDVRRIKDLLAHFTDSVDVDINPQEEEADNGQDEGEALIHGPE